MKLKTVKNLTRNNYLSKREIRDIDQPFLTDIQILQINEPTPESEIEIKKDSKGREYKSVRAAYVKRRVNLIFGFGHSFQVIEKEHLIKSNEVSVLGRLSILTKHGTIIREQFGKHSLLTSDAASKNFKGITYSNLGNGFKSAATDSFKKCASEFGICWDVYDQDLPDVEPEETDPTENLTQDQIKTHERLDHFLLKQKTIAGVETFFDKWIQDGNIAIDYTQKLVSKHLNRVEK